jgi:hypothetical protein
MSRSNRTSAPMLRASCAAVVFMAVIVVIAVLAAPAPARAEDNVYSTTWGRVLEGLGLKKADGSDEIDYRERPPLVLPNGRNLPPPEKVDAAVTNPAWPKDPDVKRRKLLEKQEKERDVEAERRRDERPLPPDQLAPGAASSVRSVKLGTSRETSDGDKILSPSELGYKGGMLGKMFRGKDDDVVQFTGEPPRTELTEPPAGYQTPSPNQPYGVTGSAPTKVENNYETRAEPVR